MFWVSMHLGGKKHPTSYDFHFLDAFVCDRIQNGDGVANKAGDTARNGNSRRNRLSKLASTIQKICRLQECRESIGFTWKKRDIWGEGG